MSRSGIPLNFLIKRKVFLRTFRPLPCVLSRERYFSTDNDDNDGIRKPKDFTESRASNTSASNATKSRATSEEVKKEDSASKKAAAGKKKLFSLLSEFKVEPSHTSKIVSNLNLAKAVKRPSKAERFKNLKAKNLTPKEKLQVAVHNVAENISGDPDQTKSDLNEKLTSLKLVDSPIVEEAIAEEITEVDEDMKKNIMSSVKEVAASVTDDNATAAIKSKLTQRLLRLSLNDSTSTPKKSIDTLLKGMKIEQSIEKPKERAIDKAEYSQKTAQRPKNTVNIFQSPPLDLFSLDTKASIVSKKTVWQSLEKKNLKLLVQFAPANGFEEMILWTDQGKHWKFPIDNEIEMGDEENIGFNEHVFLEQHLHGFPAKGPVRQFMELVTVGLSKNPYITVERKIENIDWFRNYFKEKEEILKHHGALG